MRMAGHTLGTPHQTLPEALSLFRAAGLDAAEVNYTDEYKPALPMNDMAAAVHAREIAARIGVDIIGLTPYTTSINDLDPEARKAGIAELRGCMRAAEAVGARVVRVYAGSWQQHDTDREAAWSALVESLRALAPKARDHGVTLCVENHFGTMTQTAAESVRLVHEVDSPAVRILYDQANLTFTHDEPFREAVALQSGLIAHVHVKDLVFTDPDKPFVATETAKVNADERTVRSRPVGDGILPWPEIIAALARSGYDGSLAFEYEYRWHADDLPDPVDGFARCASYTRAILESLDIPHRSEA